MTEPVQTRGTPRCAWLLLALLIWASGLPGEHAPGAVATLAPAVSASEAVAPPWGQVGGAMNAAVEHAGLLWLGVGPRVIVLDLAQPSQPRVVGRSEILPGVVTDLALGQSPERIWATAGERLVAFAPHDPTHPRITATVEVGGSALRVAVDGASVWAMDSAGAIVGIEGSAQGEVGPTVRLLPAEAQKVADLAAGGGHLYRLGMLAEGTEAPAHIDRWDITRPEAPRPLDQLALAGGQGYLSGHEQILWRDQRLWVMRERSLGSYVEGSQGLELASHDEFGWGGFAVGLVLDGDRAYASFASGYSDNYAVGVFDLTDPNAIRALNTPGWTIGRYPGVFSHAMALLDGTLWVASSGGFLTGLLAGPETHLRLSGSFATVGEVQSVDLDEGRLIATSEQSMQLVTTEAPLEPAHLALVSAGYHYGHADASGELVASAVRGQSDMMAAEAHLYRRRGERAFDLMAEIGSHMPAGWYNEVALSGPALVHVVKTLSGGVYAVYDVSDPSAPRQASRSAVGGRPTLLSLEDGQLLSVVIDGPAPALRLVRHDLAGFELVDPESQALRGGMGSSIETWLARSGERVAVLARDRDPDAPAGALRYRQHLFVLDLPPDGPMTLRSSTDLGCPDDSFPVDSALAGEHLLVACTGYGTSDGRGVAILDLGDPDAPQPAQHLRIPFAPTGIAVADDHLYVATGATGLLVYRKPPGGWGDAPGVPPTATAAPPATATDVPTATGTPTTTGTPTATGMPTATGTPTAASTPTAVRTPTASGTPPVGVTTPTPAGSSIWLPRAER